MRWAFVLCVGLGFVASPLAAETFPYTAYVAPEGAIVRSGPGPTYYPTGELTAGASVEVYRIDPGGWCAIRPPEGSFSWVPGEAVQLTGEEGLGQIAEEHVMTRVGTTLGPESDVEYIELDLGELVEVQGVDRKVDAQGNVSLWFRIAPPAGEFRYVELAELLPRTVDEAAAAAASAELVELTSADGQRVADWVASAEATTAAPAQFVEVEPATPLAGQPLTVQPLAPQPLATPPQGFAPVDSPQAQATTLAQLELELAAMVAKEPSEWQLGMLRDRVNAATSASTDAQQQARGRALLAKVEEFESIHRRYVDLGPLPLTPEAPRPRRSFLSDWASGFGGARYDGQGYLTRVTTDDPTKRLYGLTDANGRILYLVSETPGLNLSTYEGREVGILGQHGYVPAPINKRHLWAERIIDLERTR